MNLLAIFVGLVFCYTLISRKLGRTVITAPILFTVAGMATFAALQLTGISGGKREPFLMIAELGLVLLLFSDASHTDLTILRSIRRLPVRLLSIGMLLTILLGALCARLVFPQFSIWEAGILAAILAPTDAGLGQIIVTSPRVPLSVRQALNVEAGLNDGLSVPFLLFFMALAETATLGTRASLMGFIVEQLGFGILVALGIGLPAGWLLNRASRRGWMSEPLQQLGVITLPLLCVLASEAVGASMFIAAFVAGLAVQVGFQEAGRHSGEFTEQSGQLLTLAVFFLFGMLVARGWGEFTWNLVLYAILSLTLVRMLPVAVALIGTRLSRATVLFMGWFGPRGLASIVLGLVFLEHSNSLPGESTIRLAVMVTVLLSIFVHGFSALPGISLYARSVERMAPDTPEHRGESLSPHE
ncbi:MAG: cation:proton antiporter [Candidatus Deferrimicrobiaceae bacterium]